ncbi:Uma2 family endonuclease [Microbacterium sp. No. 7]|uniref:Uma2 family endonuclease n=1 Tax=Microbacterium sp. No. 7 TaxID=1714373 RepID=UPI0012E2E944|nr:Uma2 family endonuclease [Microbacterium sp. No. 7]
MAIDAPTFLPYGRELTRADLEALPDDGHRYELLDGALVVTPSPRFRHQDAVGGLHVVLRNALPSDHMVLVAPFDVVLASDTVLQPDLLVAPRAAFTETHLPGPPSLAVEVLSPSTRGIDLLLKKERLERAGCPHYWVVDPDAPSIVAWDLVDGTYRETAGAAGDEHFEVTTPFPVAFSPASLIG